MKEMKIEIPQWVIEYNNANHQSSAGKAIKILMDENERMAELLKEERNKAIDECIAEMKRFCIALYSNGFTATPEEISRSLESLKSQSDG